MPYQAKPMPFDPKSITGISEKVLVSHYENNYVGAVKRLNAIGTQLAELDFAKAPNFVVNGLKREELIASNSMILHEIYFDGLGGGAKPGGALADAIARDFGSLERWRAEFSAMGKADSQRRHNPRQLMPPLTRLRLAISMAQSYVRRPGDTTGSGENGGLPNSPLTPREIEVVKLLAEGKSNKEVASTLGVSTRTIESHRNHIMHKMNFASFSELIRFALRTNLVEP